MEVVKYKNSRKCYKKNTKILNCIQSYPEPKNYNFKTEKLIHQRIQIANLRTEKNPTLYQGNPNSCKYFIVKRRFSVRRRMLRKTGECMSNSQELTRRCKQKHLNNLFIGPPCCDSEMNRLNKILKDKSPSENVDKCYKSFQNSVTIAKNKFIDAKSFKPKKFTNKIKENVCLMNNELNSENALLFQCSANSLQLEQPKIIENKSMNLRKNLNITQAGQDITKKENYNSINDILPKMIQQVTVFKMFEDLNEQSYNNNSEDNMYSSISTCSSLSSTREYYLPAVSSSTDTVHVANVLANRKLVELINPQKETIPKQQNSNQGICKNNCNINNSNLSPIFQQTPLKNGISPFKNIEMKEVELGRLKNSNEIIKMFKDNNEGLLPFFPFTNFNSLLMKNKSMLVKNHEQSNIRVQTQHEDDSIINETIMNNKTKLSNEKFFVNNIKHNESLHKSMKTNNKNPLKSLSSVTTQNFENSLNNFNKANKEAIGKLNKHLNNDCLHIDKKEKVRLDCNGSYTTLSNISMSRDTNKSISEDLLTTITEKGNKIYQSKRAISKPKSSMCLSNKKSKSLESPLCFKSYPNTSNDSINPSKPYFVKLNPFFDPGFKDPKISKLLLSSKTLAGECDSAIDKAGVHSGLIDSLAENLSEEQNVNLATMPCMALQSSINKENKLEVKHSCPSNRSIFATDSIIYGSNAFREIREKFNLMKSERQVNKESMQFQERGTINKQRVIIPNRSWEESFQGLNNGKSNTQSIDYNNSSHNNIDKTTFSNSVIINDNNKKVSRVSSENERFSVNKKYPSLLPKNLDISNHQLEHYVKELSHINEKEKIINFSSIHDRSVGIRTMDNEHELTNIDLKSSSTKGLKRSSDNHETKNLEKGTVYSKCLLEKQTQVNMYLAETSRKDVRYKISNEIPMTEIEETSTAVSGKDEAMMNYRTRVEATVSNNNRTETILNNYDQTKTTISDCIAWAEATILNNYGQPVILYNSSGYPITDLNGRVLKNNLGAYLLNTDKYDDVVTKQLPVFDCDLISVSNTCFNPTKVPFCEIQLKITDRCGNPVPLFNNLGWPLTNEDGFFLHDNHGKLLVKIDNFNFPFCCSNGSPIYLKNGAMLLSQKFKFIVTKAGSDINFNIRSLNIRKRSENQVNSNHSKENNKNNCIKPIKNIQLLNESDSIYIKNSNFRKPMERKPDFRHNLFFPTEVPELMHEFFNNKANPRFSNFRRQGEIPQSPIPIFDRSGNRLTDEYGFPLKNKFGEYMLLLDKNGIALSDSCGGPIFDSNGKQLWLKDLYHMKKCPSFNYLYDRYMPPEHPYIDTSAGSINLNLHDSSDDVIPLLDLNFETDQSSEPVMNYIKENEIKGYDVDAKQINFIQDKRYRSNRKPKWTSFIPNVSIPKNEKRYIQCPITTLKGNMLFHEIGSYQEDSVCENLHQSFSHLIHDSNIPYTCEQSIYEDSLFRECHSQLFNLEQYDNCCYHDQGYPENYEIHEDEEIQYFVDDNNYVYY